MKSLINKLPVMNNSSKKNTSALNFIKTTAILGLVLVVFSSSRLYSQISIADITEAKGETSPLKKNAVENLISNISSDNPGVRKTAIYYAGYYRLKEAVAPLVSQMQREKDPSVRILISLSLYKLAEAKALEAVKNLSKGDSDPRVRRMCSAIYSEYEISKQSVAAN